jgi:hypothetical protein
LREPSNVEKQDWAPDREFGNSIGREGLNVFVSRLTAEVLVGKRAKILGLDGDPMLVLGRVHAM